MINTLKRCEVCGKVYKPTGYNQRFCYDCKPRQPKSRDKECLMCGARFTDGSLNNNTRYCSDRCRRLAHNITAADWICKKRTDILWESI